MKIIIMTFGSRGDIQPFLALALALHERGHTVTLAAPSDFETLIGAYGIPFIRIPFNNMALLESEFGQKIRREGINPATMFALWRDHIPQLKHDLLTTTHLVADAARQSDLLISHGFLIPAAYSIHQHTQVPLLLGFAAPIIPTRMFPVIGSVPFGQQFYNPLTFQLVVRGVLSFMIGPMNTYRREVGLPPLSMGKVIQILFSGQFPILMLYSRYLQQPPADWPASVQVVGTWTLPAPSSWTPPAALEAFLAQGDAPVYIGFGSMPVANPAKMAQTISEALRLANRRGVLQSGWAGLAYDDAHLLTIGDTPHDWLFPRMAAIVHHGGSGTTHSALMAGKPALIVPFSGDQPFWGRRIAAIGVGVPPIAPKHITPERLADAVRTLTQDSSMRQRAAELGAQMRAEDGLKVACEWIERQVAGT